MKKNTDNDFFIPAVLFAMSILSVIMYALGYL